MIPSITMIATTLATGYDLRYKRIPNSITLPAICLGVLINTYQFGFGGFTNAFLGMFLGASLLMIPFALGGMGAGDVKLLAAVGALNGPQFVFFAFIYMGIAGGIIALAIIAAKGQILPVFYRLSFAFSKPGRISFINYEGENKTGFAYGAAIMIGTAAAYLLRY